MKKGYKQIGYRISMLLLALLAWNPKLVIIFEDVIDSDRYVARLFIVIIMLVMLPHVLDSFEDEHGGSENNQLKKSPVDETKGS